MLFIIPFNGFSQINKINRSNEIKDSTASIMVNGKIRIANVGFAPIPAFSFDSPIAIGSLSVKKRGFSYEPDFALGLNGKPWIINNWFRLNVMDGKTLKLRASMNPALFFKSDWIASGEEVLQAQRNLSFELACKHRLSKKWSLSLTYLYNKGCDHGTLSGHFIDMHNSFPDITISKMISMNLKPQLFYFDFDGNIDGLFTSGSIGIEHQQIPVSIYFQGVLPLWTNFPGNHFNWSIGFAYTF